MKTVKIVPFSQVPRGARFFLNLALYRRNDFGDGLGAFHGLHFKEWSHIEPDAICRVVK